MSHEYPLRRVVKYIVSIAVKPVLVRYLSTTRTYRYRNVVLQVPPEVFHPGFFFSTKLLLRYLCTLPLRGRRLLELGAGSGLISIVMAQLGSYVVATDINETALQQLEANAIANAVALEIRQSDLFNELRGERFDMIAINPPYFKGTPRSEREYAWYCGPAGEYFARLFRQLEDHIYPHSEVLMVLSDGCDREMIAAHAAAAGFRMQCVLRRPNLMETNFIYRIEKMVHDA
ncbi:MAG: methyltransferase domain-containing protein [Chitinophagaceae bacterium]|nr:MAG: methyltransferase domain-containing protein [Chitinophagaceae bacterium]